MFNILCFGDSNTWGYVPRESRRYSKTERWTGLMAAALGAEFHVIEEGLNGRTTAFTDYLEPYRNGLDSAAPCMLSHAPLDFIILMLGTNDTKPRYCVSSGEITEGMENLIRTLRFHYPTKKYPMPPILLVAPGPLAAIEEEYAFDSSSSRKVKELVPRYEALAKEMDCLFFNAQSVLTEEDLGGDGIHLKKEGHAKLARSFTEIVRDYFKNTP
ncbi:MAG: SGNH/GDSL hydrolase family protein [Lachnospiraceae bacterium]|nr:SGNH/GDSL hydrolase family protein [Lachnospiraceae bacterium]